MIRHIHKLKTHQTMFDAIKRGVKNFDVRKDDRAFQAGDLVELRGVDNNHITAPFPQLPMTTEPITKIITFVLRGGQYGIKPGYVVLALEDVQ